MATVVKKPISAEADDLNDGLEYDFDGSVPEMSEENGELEPLSEEDEVKKEEDKTNNKKRKASSNLKDKKRIKMEMDMDRKKKLAQEESVEAIADYFNAKIRQKNSDLSALELAELYFNKTDFRSTSFLEEERSLDNYSKLITSKFKSMLGSSDKKKNKKKNKKVVKPEETKPEEERKFIAVVSMSAIRACDVHRALTDLPGSSLKLINKNKLNVDLKLVKTTRSRILCCTPGRLQKVLASEDLELKPEEIKIVILDSSYLNQKCQNISDIEETVPTLKELTKTGSKIYLY